MSNDDEKNSGNTKDIIDAVTGLVEAVPVYQDAVQPASKVVGKSLETVAKTVDTLLMPLRGVIWGAEQFEDFLKNKVTKKLANTPPENIQSPDPKIAGPALESLRFTTEKDEELQDSYANLFANAMNKKSEGIAHPAFVEILRQFDQRDLQIAKVVLSSSGIPAITVNYRTKGKNEKFLLHRIVTLLGKQVKGIGDSDIQASIENLSRLGLLELEFSTRLTARAAYDAFEHLTIIKRAKSQVVSDDKLEYDQAPFVISPTEMGRRFHSLCLAPYK